MILVPAVILATLMTASADQAGPPPPALVFTPAPASLPQVHRFWDWQNVALFSGVAAARTFDFFSTSKFRDKHLKEWLLDDETVDNRPLFASIEMAGTALSIAASYAFHRTGHHRLERWVSILHVGIATAGGIWNCTLPNGL